MAEEADVNAVGRRHRQRSLLEAAEELARRLGRGKEAAALRRRRASSFESEARERADEGGIIELAFMEDAAELYAASGPGSEVQRLKPDLARASERPAIPMPASNRRR